MLPGVALAAVLYWAWRARAAWGRHVILGLGFFIIMIAPALGLMKMAYMRITLVADHFQYVPMMGLLALAAAGIAHVCVRWNTPPVRYAVNAAAGCAIALLCVLTWRRADVFHDPESLWRDTLAKNDGAWQAHEHLGGILLDRGDLQAALVHFRRGVEIRPWLGETHNNYGNILRGLRIHPDQALEENRKAVELVPDNINIRVSYGDALVVANRPAEAVAQYQAALAMNPANPGVWNNLGVIYMRAGYPAQAVDYFRQALRYDPNFPPAQAGLRDALRGQAQAQAN
jgi:Tfp pilus assembly protein PilF